MPPHFSNGATNYIYRCTITYLNLWLIDKSYFPFSLLYCSKKPPKPLHTAHKKYIGQVSKANFSVNL